MARVVESMYKVEKLPPIFPEKKRHLIFLWSTDDFIRTGKGYGGSRCPEKSKRKTGVWNACRNKFGNPFRKILPFAKETLS